MTLWHPWIQFTKMKKSPYQIIYILYISIHIAERISEKQDGSIMIMEGSHAPNIFFATWSIYMKTQLFILVIIVHSKGGGSRPPNFHFPQLFTPK